MTKPLTTETAQAAGAVGKQDIAVIAGSGMLPQLLARELTLHGKPPLVMAIEAEAGEWTRDYPGFTAKTVEMSRIVRELKSRGIRRVVLAGGVRGRPDWHAVRLDWFLLSNLRGIYQGLRSGDDGLLRVVVGMLEKSGMTVVGAHEIMPDLLTQSGTPTKRQQDDYDRLDIKCALHAARELGRLDIGQAAVAVGGRVVAVEGAEGTDSMLARVREMRLAGRISQKARGVLVKAAKPAQELRTDLPSIGPDTINRATEAGLAGIALEAERSLVLDYAQTMQRANEHGLFVSGIAPGADA
jgi:UDP-2,3-diacylglucosamine hydrolase